MEIVAGMNFTIMAKFIPATLRLPQGPFSFLTALYKGILHPPPPPPLTFSFTPSPEPPLSSRALSPAAAECPFRALSLRCCLCHHCPNSQHTAARRCRALIPAAASPLPPSPGPPRPCCTPDSSAMVRTHGGHCYRPRVRFSSPERDDVGTSRAADAHSTDQAIKTPPTLAPTAISEEAQALEPPSRRYQTRVGPRAPSPVHPRPRQRASPSKRARTSGLGESSRSRPELSPPPADQGSSPQFSPASRIKCPMFSCDPIPESVDLHARDFHMESYYDIPALTADQRFRDSMRLIRQYSLLPFMTPR